MKRTASALWSGTLKDGQGSLSSPSGVFKQTPYSFRSRFGDGGETNPEELIAAAHAGCFSMALSNILGKANLNPERIATTANLDFDQVDGAWTIKAIHLDLIAKVPGIDQAKLESLANEAKLNCPVSRVLKAEITMSAKLEK
ncbi:MAG: OsmC family protein [Gemmataceae bacterium]